MENICENCPHEGNIEENDCFCDALYEGLIRHEMLERLDLMGITEADLENGVYKSETVPFLLSTEPWKDEGTK